MHPGFKKKKAERSLGTVARARLAPHLTPQVEIGRLVGSPRHLLPKQPRLWLWRMLKEEDAGARRP